MCHTLILNDQQIFDKEQWQEKIGASIKTTGNELEGEQIADFSKELNVPYLYEYACSVMNATDEFLQSHSNLSRPYYQNNSNYRISW